MSAVANHAATQIANCCPACASSQTTQLHQVEGSSFFWRRCPKCGLRFSEPMQAADSSWYEHSPIYRDLQVWQGAKPKAGVMYWNFRQALDAIRGAGKRLLDVGCGTGEFLAAAMRDGFDVSGSDFNPESLEYARRVYGIQSLYQCSNEELARRVGEGAFDVVTMFEVLEHTSDPFRTLLELKRLVAPGGLVCISVPGDRRWPGFFDPVADNPPHHLTLWTEEALKSIFERAGFSDVQTSRKPLEALDIGGHLRWAAGRALKRLRRSERSAAPAATGAPRAAKARGSLRLVRWVALAAVSPVCWLLKINPRAGGYTLFARAQRVA